MHQEATPNDRGIVCQAQNPVILAIDVTGSMQDWPKVIFDKLPMFYGQVMMQGYLDDPAICFCSTADYTDKVPLAVTEFAQGNDLDDKLKQLGLGGGGGSAPSHEAYELAAWYFVNRVRCPNAVTKPILIFTADEFMNTTLKKQHVTNICGGNEMPGTEMQTADIFKELRKMYDVFLIHKEYSQTQKDPAIVEQWESMIGGERVLKCNSPKAAADLMLGAIALAAGSRNMDAYMQDMDARGQDAQRMKEVHSALEAFSKSSAVMDKYAAAMSESKKPAAAPPAPSGEKAAMELELLQTKAELARMKASANPSDQALQVAAELAETNLELAQMKAAPAPMSDLERVLSEDIERIASGK